MKKILFFLFINLIINIQFVEEVFSQSLNLHKNLGWASITDGGFGGSILRVTNLNAAGDGSLEAALAAKVKRVVVFEVGGVIDLKGAVLKVNNPYLTIMGQTAPSPGITIVNGSIMIQSHDVIVQHIRIRPGSKYKDKELDGLTTYKKAYNVIVDHCSITWAVDENLSASGPRFEGGTPDEWRQNTSHNIAFSNNIIAEALFHSTHSKGSHSMGTLVHDNVSNILIIRNLYANNNDRNAFFKGGSRGVFLNNYVFNPGIFALRYALVESEWASRVKQVGYISVVGNVVQMGDNTDGDVFLFECQKGPLKLYLNDNNIYNKSGVKINRIYKGDANNIVGVKPIWHEDLIVLNSSQLQSYLISNVGARPWDRDAVDKRIVENSFLRKGALIDSELQVGGLPNILPSYKKFILEEWDLKSLEHK